MRIIARDHVSSKRSLLIRTLGILLALVTGAIFLAISGFDPFKALLSLVEGAFGTQKRIVETVEYAIPLVITSLGIALAFRIRFWNIGAEGQIIMGAVAASYFALFHPEMPLIFLYPVMILVSCIAGAVWAGIPALFKVKWGTNETLVTLMFNYIALQLLTFLQYNAWKDPAAHGFAKIAMFDERVLLPEVFGVNIGWIIALVLIAAMYFFVGRSKAGYRLNVIGESVDTARYAGIKVPQTILLTVCAGGAMAGLTGFIQALGVEHTINVNVSAGYGYTAIITTWLARLKPINIGIVCLLFAGLIQGGEFIQTAYKIPNAAAQVFQGLILFFVLGCEFFLRYKVIFGKAKEAA